jgi:DNA-binding HxlR family transcriptional regulator
VADDGEVTHEPRACDAALARAFTFLGKRWSGVILGVLMEGPSTFSGLRRGVGGISDSVLSDRLAELASAGLVLRSVDTRRSRSRTNSRRPGGRSCRP